MLILIMTVAVLAPLLACGAGRRLPVPLVIFETLLGIVIGPDVLGWAQPDALVDGLSRLGLTVLIFLAGYEIGFGKVRGDTLRRSVWAWPAALALGLAAGVLLGGGRTLLLLPLFLVLFLVAPGGRPGVRARGGAGAGAGAGHGLGVVVSARSVRSGPR
ncbi:cation:proton antiporter [Streptomyces sp. NPDC101160]|uniref:cation:proton antiporter domain-containing protein n=1 Tax=Streptomyces sp. NPDC101160 TaxID=3366118 RepID=UPI003821F0C5